MTLSTQATVFSNTWNTIYAVLNTNLTNLKPARRKWVSSSFPDIRSRESRQLNQDIFPWIVVNPVNASTSAYGFGYSGREFNFDIRVDILAAGSGANRDLDVLCNDVYDELMKARPALAASGVVVLEMSGSNDDVLDVNEQLRIHQRTMMFTGRHLI